MGHRSALTTSLMNSSFKFWFSCDEVVYLETKANLRASPRQEIFFMQFLFLTG